MYYNRTESFLCNCGDVSHNMIFQLHDYNSDNEEDEHYPDDVELFIYIKLNQCYSFWKRVGNAIRYILNLTPSSGDYDGLLLKYEDVDRMQNILTEYRNRYNRNYDD